MIWVLSVLVLCLIGAVVTLWQNLSRAVEAGAALERRVLVLEKHGERLSFDWENKP